HSKHCIRFRAHASDIVIEDGTINSGRQSNDNFAVGIGLDDNASGLAINRVTATNCHAFDDPTNTIHPGDYWNGDRVSSESTNTDIQYVDCLSTGHTDAGFDNKGPQTYHVRCTAKDSKKLFKLWPRNVGGERIYDNCHSYNGHKRGGISGREHFMPNGTT